MGTIFKDISIHALRGESDRGAKVPDYVSGKFQSTLSVGRATVVVVVLTPMNLISIHALRGESDSSLSLAPPNRLEFQSTLSVGRATTEDHLVYSA